MKRLMPKIVLNFKELVASYGTTKILNGFNATICQGEFVGLIGPNGAGKSTLLKCLSGLLAIDSGKIVVEGKDNDDYTYKERAQIVAVVPQSFEIDYDFTVEDIVLMGRNPYLSIRVKESQDDYDRVERAMSVTKTLQFRKRFFNSLSGGEKQRVIIARAIAQEPAIILLDEPTSALDIHHQIQVMELIRDLNLSQSLTVVAVLHDINLASRYCNRLILMKEGRVIADDVPSQVVTEENLREVYPMKMFIHENKLFKKPEIIPLRIIEDKNRFRKKHIHVIGGGNEASQVLESLQSMGHRITIGVINKGCGDWLTARKLNIEMVVEKPFTDITKESYNKNVEIMKQADMILVSDLAFGLGNVKNLKGIEALNCPVYFNQNCLNNDFTQGLLLKYYNRLKAKEDFFAIESDQEFLERLKEETAIKDDRPKEEAN